jgi:hypothetical protein
MSLLQRVGEDLLGKPERGGHVFLLSIRDTKAF